MIKRRDIYWGVGAQILNVASGLLLLPVILNYLTSIEIGLWYVFAALASLNQLLEFGFQPTIVRNAAYVYGGATQLHAKGLGGSVKDNDISNMSPQLLGQLLCASRYIYRWVALFSLIIICFGGAVYINTLSKSNVFGVSIWVAWICYASGLIITAYYGYLTALLLGRGDVTLSNKVVVFSRLAMISVAIFLVVNGCGLIGLGVSTLVTAIVSRFLSYYYFYTSTRPETRYLRKMKLDRGDVVAKLWLTASQMGIVSLGGFLILKSTTFIISSFIGLSSTASYGITVQVLNTISGIATTVRSLLIPRMNTLQIQNDHETLRIAFSVMLVSAWIVYLIGVTILIAFGSALLEFMGSQTQLLSISLLITLSTIMLLEMNHSLAASYLTTLNEIPFVRSAIFSGISIVFISIIAILYFDAGIWGIVATQGIVQASFNNWYWPKIALKQLNLNSVSMIKCGLLNIKYVFNK